MSYESAVAAITAHFAQEWNNATPVAYPDVPFNPPSSTWVRLNISHADGYQASIGSPGSNKFRRTGLVTVQVFQKQGKAGVDAHKKADLAVAAFLGKKAGHIQFYDVQAREIGNDGAGYFQINVLAYFQYDVIA